jgi:hypothetical protein
VACTNYPRKSLFENRRKLVPFPRRLADGSMVLLGRRNHFIKFPHKSSRYQDQKHFESDIERYKAPRRKGPPIRAHCAGLPLSHQADPSRMIVPQLWHPQGRAKGFIRKNRLLSTAELIVDTELDRTFL